MLDLSVIIISYNTKDLTLACLQSIYQQTKGISFEVFVVDNASHDNSAATIANNFPQVHLIKSDKNMGFAKANNLAAEIASGDYILLLNPDTVVLDGAIQNLHQFAIARPDHLIYGGRTLFEDRTLNPDSCWRQPSLWSVFCYAVGLVSIFRGNKFFNPESYGSWQRDSIQEVDIITGCFLLIKKTFWEELKGFDPEFFMYGEDADLCLRARKKGARPVITQEATIVHYCGASEKVRADKMVRLFRAKEQLIRHHWGAGSRGAGIALLRLSVFTRMLACNILKSVGFRRFRDSAQSWLEIWQRRKEWQISC